MPKYYCHECKRQCSVIPVDDIFPYEFWGQISTHRETYIMCEQCGSYEVEEYENEEELSL